VKVLFLYGPADETVIAQAAEIAAAVRSAPPGTRVRADARDDRTFLGVSTFSEADRTDEFEDVLPDDQVAYFWNPDATATAETIATRVEEAFGPRASAARQRR
jgi:hypothetical protein